MQKEYRKGDPSLDLGTKECFPEGLFLFATLKSNRVGPVTCTARGRQGTAVRRLGGE